MARARSAMSALSALEKRLTALVPPTTEASAPPDQRSLFELLAETAATTLRSSSGEVKEAQRPLEDALLRVTCGGWAGPAVRVTAANVLANLFFVGNEVALYSCVNELVAVAFAEDDKKAPSLVSRRDRAGETAGTPPLVAGASLRAAKRIGALDALTRLANKGHAESMRGAAAASSPPPRNSCDARPSAPRPRTDQPRARARSGAPRSGPSGRSSPPPPVRKVFRPPRRSRMTGKETGRDRYVPRRAPPPQSFFSRRSLSTPQRAPPTALPRPRRTRSAPTRARWRPRARRSARWRRRPGASTSGPTRRLAKTA